MEIKNPETNSFLRMLNGDLIKWEVLDIPPWNMTVDSAIVIPIPTSINASTVIIYTAVIWNDAQSRRWVIPYWEPYGGRLEAFFSQITFSPAAFYIHHELDGTFNDVGFTSTAMNRGKVIISYSE